MTTVGLGAPERGESASLSEAQLLGLMAAVWVAVMAAVDTPLIFGAAMTISGFAAPKSRRRLFVACGLVLVATSLGSAAEAGYLLADAQTLVSEPAILMTDTEPSDFGWRAEGRLDRTDQRVSLVGAGFQRPDLVAGQPVVVSGRLGPVKQTDWHKSRHLVGVVSAAEVVPTGDVAWFRRPGEWLRSGVLGATASFSDEQAALYHGLVIGDDRFQSEGQRAQFRAAGLSHLLAVSGQNVSFLLAVFAPFTRRLQPAVGFGLVACLLVVFALATRLEPSVLRATATAGVSTLATVMSARSAGVRSLSIAVIVLMLVDPFLAWSIGFRLSVGASVGILLLGPQIRSRIRLPGWVADPMSITVAAQIGVSPILMAVFGPVATVTIPANLLAGWAAGAVMTLGLSLGLVASVMPGPVAGAMQRPAQVLVWWIDLVASEAARAPLPALSAGTLPWLVIAGLLVWWLRPRRWLAGWWIAPLLLTLVLSSNDPTNLDGWHAGTQSSPSVLVIQDPSERWVEAIVGSRIESIDVVVVADGGWTTARTVGRLREVVDIGVVLAPGDHQIVGGRRVLDDAWVLVGDGRLEISAKPDELEINFVVGASSGDR